LEDKNKDIEQKIASTLNLDRDFFITTPYGKNLSVNDITENPYNYQYWIFSMCKTICLNCLKIDWKICDKKNKNLFLDDHEVTELLECPNPWLSETAFKEMIILGLLLSSGKNFEDTGGQVFIVGEKKKGKGNFCFFDKGEIPQNLFCYWEKRQQYSFGAKLDKNGSFSHWCLEWNDNCKTKIDFEPGQVIRVNFLNPNNWYRGLSWFTPAGNQTYQDILSDVYNSMFFENDGRVAGILKFKDEMTEEQLRLSMQRWNQNYGSAGRNGKIAALDNGAEYQQFSPTHSDMQFKDLKDLTHSNLLACFGLNKIALGNYESINFATIKEGRRMLYHDTYIPLVKIILSAFNNQWIRHIGNGNLRLVYDVSNVDAMMPDYSNLPGPYQALINSGVPPVVAARKLGVSFTESEIEEYPWLNERVNNSSFVLNKPNKENIKNEDETDDEKDGKKNTDKIIKKTLDQKIEKNRVYNKKFQDEEMRPIEESFLNRLYKTNEWLNDRLVDKVNNYYTNLNSKNISSIVIKSDKIDPEEFMPNFKLYKIKFLDDYKKMVKDVTDKLSVTLPNETNGIVVWDSNPEKWKRYVALRKKQIEEIHTTTFEKYREKIGEALKESMENDLILSEQRELILEAISETGEIRKNQSVTIARTEVGTVTSQERYDSYVENDVEMVEWSAYHDDATRDSHIACEQEGPIRLGDRFSNGLLHPGDPNGDPSEVINCRCTLLVTQ